MKMFVNVCVCLMMMTLLSGCGDDNPTAGPSGINMSNKNPTDTVVKAAQISFGIGVRPGIKPGTIAIDMFGNPLIILGLDAQTVGGNWKIYDRVSGNFAQVPNRGPISTTFPDMPVTGNKVQFAVYFDPYPGGNPPPTYLAVVLQGEWVDNKNVFWQPRDACHLAGEDTKGAPAKKATLIECNLINN